MENINQVFNLVAIVAEVWLFTVLGNVARLVAPEAPGLFIPAVLCKVAAPVTLQTPQAALFRPTAPSDTVSGKVAHFVAKVTLQSGRVSLFFAGLSQCPSDWTSTSWQSASANSSRCWTIARKVTKSIAAIALNC